jgi:hypothetical protein
MTKEGSIATLLLMHQESEDQRVGILESLGWYETLKPFWLGPCPHLQISDESKNELQSLVLIPIEKASARTSNNANQEYKSTVTG